MKGVLVASLTLLAWAPAGAGELIFANGNRLSGELSNDVLLVSTGSGLVEIASDEVVVLSREEIHLQDSRVIRGTLVGGQLKARTSLGEISVKVDDLQAYRASPPDGAPAQTTASPGPPTNPSAGTAPASAPPVAAGPARTDTGVAGGVPTVAAYQGGSNAPQSSGARGVGLQRTAVMPDSGSSATRMFEVVDESPLYRDALFGSSRVGRVVAGQQVRYVDAIDRRLRILNLLVFDGGHWFKVRLPDGTEGWVPANAVREVQ